MSINVPNEKVVKYMKLAKYNASLFSKDPHTQVGAILLSSDFSRILSTGINGFPRKLNDDIPERWERPEKYNWVAHAETNAVCNAARSGTCTDGASIVVTMFPCSHCTKTLIQAGIKAVYVPRPNMNDPKWGEDSKYSLEMMNEIGLTINYVDIL